MGGLQLHCHQTVTKNFIKTKGLSKNLLSP